MACRARLCRSDTYQIRDRRQGCVRTYRKIYGLRVCMAACAIKLLYIAEYGRTMCGLGAADARKKNSLFQDLNRRIHS